MKTESMTTTVPLEPWEVRRPPPAAAERPADRTRGTGPARPEHLVITNDAGDREEALLSVAGWLAGRAGTAVRVAHLYDSPSVGESVDGRRVVPINHDGLAVDACDSLFRAARTLAGRTGLPVAPELLTGPFDPTLTEYVRANRFDLVTAAAGGNWLSLWGRGTWYGIARRRPVVVVGPGVSDSWATRPAGGVLALLDGTPGAETILRPAAALCRMIDVRLTLLRVQPPDSSEPMDRCREYLLDVARAKLGDVPSVRTIVLGGRPGDVALGLQRGTDAIIALASPTRSRLAALTPGRLAARLIRDSSAPVLFHRPTV